MQRLLFILLLICAPIFTWSQEVVSKEDSLRKVIDKSQGMDKFMTLIELSDEMVYDEEGLTYAQEAYELAKTLSKEAEADALNAIGKFHIIHYDEAKSLDYFFKALAISEALKNNELTGKIQRNIGQAYFWLDSISLASEYTNKTLELSRNTNNRQLEADALIDLGTLAQREGKTDSALVFMQIALKIRHENNDKLEEAIAYARIGRLYFDMGDYQNSIKNHEKEIEIKEQLNDLSGLAIAYYNLGRIHRTVGNYQKALEQYQASLAIFQKLNIRTNIAVVSSDIGLVYENLSRSTLAVEENETNFKKALEFHKTALVIFEEENDQMRIAQSLNNIANNYSRLATNNYVNQFGEFWEDSLITLPASEILESFDNAFEYYNKALEIFQTVDDTREICNVNINLGSHYLYAREWRSAIKHLRVGLQLANQIKSQLEIAVSLYHMGEYYFRINDLEQAKQYLLQSHKISVEAGIKDLTLYNHLKLSRVYERQGLSEIALSHYKKYGLIKDEIFSEQSQKSITEMQTKYETKEKEDQLKLMHQQDELQKSIIQRQKLTLAIAIGGLTVILAFAGLLFNMVRQKQKANKILKEKNELISEQKQEITDSILYASRIQNAILPSESLLKEALTEHFVLFLPRDIVSGDFYWYTKLQNRLILTAADCTGHGVPGAFMSMLGISSLYEIVNKEGVVKPSEILDKLREFIKVTLSQTGKDDEQKDGMDISLCMLDIENMKLEWAGAYNPLLLIRNGELIEYKADKMPVGIHITDYKAFTNHEILLKPNDRFYMYSDGFADQFGGAEQRKYMTKRFKQFLLEIHEKPMEEQKTLLHKEHLNWRGEISQIDDIVIFGVKV